MDNIALGGSDLPNGLYYGKGFEMTKINCSLSCLTREIPLTKGKVAVVDAADYEFLSQWKWFFLNDTYAARTQYIGMEKGKPKRITIKMHQVLMDAADGYEVDHINSNGIDNRRANLRVCTHKQNRWNSSSQKGSSSKYKGVSYQKATNYYKAYIIVHGVYKHLGCYLEEDDAARAYNRAAKAEHGEYAKFNPVGEGPMERLKHPTQYQFHKAKEINYGS